ncbi:mismatch-specific DNA-glycosylase [Martelella lutilitoris]|uniref:Mismatch-specific DNA-glycosylase n=1 Tax=Martelella lutilitoris TaxID=2583532 RepID=A0A7T7KMI4_9HYPH|nr:mismatch-specific DNA-glycosylase [Martelella lutilitoris]QQM31790.1 mismatch-specific DNA-glycosylase [Martelella lutilitoris]
MIDLLAPGLRIVFCGTAKGTISARTGSFYANPSNRFYRTLHETGLTLERIDPADFRRLLDYGIGLTDLNQVESGMDRVLSEKHFDLQGFREKMLHFRPKLIAFTSLTAARIFFADRTIRCGPLETGIGDIPVVALPSTSGANAHWTRDRHHWYQLRALICRAENPSWGDEQKATE